MNKNRNVCLTVNRNRIPAKIGITDYTKQNTVPQLGELNVVIAEEPDKLNGII